jgi:hypothetical protein
MNDDGMKSKDLPGSTEILDDPVDNMFGSRKPVGEGFKSKPPEVGGSIAFSRFAGVGGGYSGCPFVLAYDRPLSWVRWLFC